MLPPVSDVYVEGGFGCFRIKAMFTLYRCLTSAKPSLCSLGLGKFLIFNSQGVSSMFQRKKYKGQLIWFKIWNQTIAINLYEEQQQTYLNNVRYYGHINRISKNDKSRLAEPILLFFLRNRVTPVSCQDGNSLLGLQTALLMDMINHLNYA